MNLRYLVPALGIVALTANSARAEDKAPVIAFSGWVDTILAVTDDNSENDPLTAKDESSASVRFWAAAALKGTWTVNQSLVAKTNIWFYPDSSTGGAVQVTQDAGTNSPNITSSGSIARDNANVQVREAYVTYALNDTFSWQMGKYIDHIGWIAADPYALTTINNSLIGYLGAYGNDVLGTALNITPDGGKDFSAQIHITNGYFTGSDAINGGTNAHRENTDLGFGFGATWNFMHDAMGASTGNLDFDFAYDMHSDQNGSAAANDLGGDVLLVGLNATVKPTSKLTLGAEIISLNMGESEDPAGVGNQDGVKRLQGLVMVNYKIREEGVPVSVTAMVQYVELKFDDPAITEKEKRLELVGAVLTNPLGTDKFGLNLEVAYWTIDNQDGGAATTDDHKGLSVAIEAIAFF